MEKEEEKEGAEGMVGVEGGGKEEMVAGVEEEGENNRHLIVI